MIWSNVTLAVYLLLIYIFLCVVFPFILLYPVIKKRSIITGLLTSIVASNVYIFLVGYILGFLGMFNRYTVFVSVIMLPLLFRILFYWKADSTSRQKLSDTIASLIKNEYGVKLFFIRIFKKAGSSVQNFYNRIFHHKILEWIVVLSCIGFSVYLYGYHKFRSYGYSTSDEEVHLYWIQSLIGNDIFPSGMYPYGMHILIAVMSVLFRINTVRITLGFSHIILIMVLATSYLVLRQMFSNKYGVLSVFILYTIGSLYVPYDRFHFTLPMEYGMPAIFILTGAIFSYIRKKNRLDWFLIVGSIIYTLSCHFYVTAFVGIICIVMGLVYFVILIKRRSIMSMIGAGIIGLLLGLLPFLTGFLLGYPFYEDSMSWAIDVISTTKENDIRDEEEKEEEQEEQEEQEEEGEKTGVNETKKVPMSFTEELYGVLLERSYKNGYFLYSTIIVVAISFSYGILGVIFAKEKEKYLLYISLSVLWIIGNLMVSSYDMSWPVFIEVKRQSVFLAYFMMILFCVPLEALYCLVKKGLKTNKWNNRLFFIICIGIGGALIYTGNIKGKDTIYYWSIQTDGAMKLILSMMDEKENYTWTVVSPVNDRSAILNSGYHYELLELVEELDNWEEDQTIYIPTQEVYFVIEKYPLEYGLVPTNNKLPIHKWKPVSFELTLVPIKEEKERSKIYQNQRGEIMSKAYYWAMEYARYYPQEMKIYYEDEEVIIYRLNQSPYRLNNLSINYWTVQQ